MKSLQLPTDDSNESAAEFSSVTSGMMRKRAIELAMNDGRSDLEDSKSDWEQVRQQSAETDEGIFRQ